MPTASRRITSRAAAFAVLVSAALHGCNGDTVPGGTACTEMFAMIPVTVIDGAGQPVEAASVTAVLLRTGETLVPTSLALTEPGTYLLADDGSINVIRQSGDQVQARIAKGALSLAVDYVFAVPDGCHVSKVSGPDTVTLQ